MDSVRLNEPEEPPQVLGDLAEQTTSPASNIPEISNNLEVPRPLIEAVMEGRKLIVCIDGTSNQFGDKNTNVVELYSRIKKNPSQLTYYNSGIGTYAKPSWRSYTYIKQVLTNVVDLAIAWNLESVIIGAYRWLSDKYRPGDQIFLFGFSRGAYQVRALAAMIEKAGLIYAGNQEQIPYAWELYSNEDRNIAKFKETFSWGHVDLHFVGVWDTVSSVGVLPRKLLPLTGTCDHIQHFRHALSLDERRVRFLPEYLESSPGDFTQTSKEVWFSGTHSDIGGGNKANRDLSRGGEPLKWMMEEAQHHGLEVRLHDLKIGIPNARVTESLKGVWWILEWIPISRTLYGIDRQRSVTRWPNRGRPRVVMAGHKIHWSVRANIEAGAHIPDSYIPKARIVVFREGQQKLVSDWRELEGANDEEPADIYEFSAPMGLIKSVYELSKGDEGFQTVISYIANEKSDILWTYGGPLLLHHVVYKNVSKEKEHHAAVRRVIGLEELNGLSTASKKLVSRVRRVQAVEEVERINDKPNRIEHLKTVVIPRVRTVLEECAEEDIIVAKPVGNSFFSSFLNWFKRSHNRQDYEPIHENWSLRVIPKADRSNELACIMMEILLELVDQDSVCEIPGMIPEMIDIILRFLPGSNEPIVLEQTSFLKTVLDTVVQLSKYEPEGPLRRADLVDRSLVNRNGNISRLFDLLQPEPGSVDVAVDAVRAIGALGNHGKSIPLPSITPDGITKLISLATKAEKIPDLDIRKNLLDTTLFAVAKIAEYRSRKARCLKSLLDNQIAPVLINLLRTQGNLVSENVLKALVCLCQSDPALFPAQSAEELSGYMTIYPEASIALSHTIAGRDEVSKAILDKEDIGMDLIGALESKNPLIVQAVCLLLNKIITFDMGDSTNRLVSLQVFPVLVNLLDSNLPEVLGAALEVVDAITASEAFNKDIVESLVKVAQNNHSDKAILVLAKAVSHNDDLRPHIGPFIDRMLNIMGQKDAVDASSAMFLLSDLLGGEGLDYFEAEAPRDKLILLLTSVLELGFGPVDDLHDAKTGSRPPRSMNICAALCMIRDLGYDDQFRAQMIEAGLAKTVWKLCRDCSSVFLINIAKGVVAALMELDDAKAELEGYEEHEC